MMFCFNYNHTTQQLKKSRKVSTCRITSDMPPHGLPVPNYMKHAIRFLAASTKHSDKICPRKSNFSEWYNDVLRLSGMVDDSPVRGCMIICPWGMKTWELFRNSLDGRFKDKGVDNVYFPLFIPQSFIAREAEHVDGFAKECAVVTHHRLCKDPDTGSLIPDPSALLTEPLIVRPTSEAAIWSTFAKWIQSYRDLPLRVNQWANVVRWEMRPRPFLRTSEFLWQEGHTAHETRDDAIKTAREMLDLYSSICRDMLCLPTISGVKSPSERFAGAEDTFTIEACVQNGWALQCGTSHFLGQNFAKAFNVQYDSVDLSTGRCFVWGTSWGVSTRLMGALVMTHADDIGLVLPPAVAPLQVIILPILKKGGIEEVAVSSTVDIISRCLHDVNVRCKTDPCEASELGSRRFAWELKGVPVRLEIGSRDVQTGKIIAAIRYNSSKITLPLPSCDDSSIVGGGLGFAQQVKSILGEIQSNMLKRAEQHLKDATIHVSSYSEMKNRLDTISANNGDDSDCSRGLGLFVVPWKDNAKNEEFIKDDCKATIRCFPDDLNTTPPADGIKCFYSGEQATHFAIFARAY